MGLSKENINCVDIHLGLSKERPVIEDIIRILDWDISKKKSCICGHDLGLCKYKPVIEENAKILDWGLSKERPVFVNMT